MYKLESFAFNLCHICSDLVQNCSVYGLNHITQIARKRITLGAYLNKKTKQELIMGQDTSNFDYNCHKSVEYDYGENL